MSAPGDPTAIVREGLRSLKAEPTATRIVLPEMPPCYRPKDAAATTRVSRPYIAAEIKAGRLQALKIGHVVLIPREALQRWLDERAVPWGPNGDAA